MKRSITVWLSSAAVMTLAATVAFFALTDNGAGAKAGGTVHTGGAALTLRTGTSTSSSALTHIPNGKWIGINCQTNGSSVSGHYGTSKVWDKTSYGGHTGYVSDSYVYTGSDGRIAGNCSSGSGSSGKKAPYVHTGGTALSLRKSASTGSAKLTAVPNGTHISISCQTNGSSVSGTYGSSSVWDKTSYSGHTGYVSDAYVYTGSDGLVAGKCSGGSTPPPPPSGGSVSAKVKAVINAALSQTGKGYSYSWAAGGKNGASYGVCCSPSGYNDTHRLGYDCSGLTQYAFWAGAHLDIGGWTGTQWSSGKQHPYSQRKPGDLLFWGTGNSTTHVAIYLGNGKMIEAAPPRGSNSVHVTSVYGSHSVVIRPIG